MKKLVLGFLFAVVLTSNADAASMTWTDIIDWNKDIRLKDAACWNELTDGFGYYHDLSDNGFDPSIDTIVSYRLKIRIYDDFDRARESAGIIQPGIPLLEGDAVTAYQFSWDFADIGWTVAGLLDINHDGTLNIWIEPLQGDFYLDYSILTATGQASPVPEPATLIILGIGLMGGAFAIRKKTAKS